MGSNFRTMLLVWMGVVAAFVLGVYVLVGYLAFKLVALLP